MTTTTTTSLSGRYDDAQYDDAVDAYIDRIAPPERLIRCRYRRRNDEMCSNPSLDQAPDALIHICVRHASRTLQLISEHKAKTGSARRTR